MASLYDSAVRGKSIDQFIWGYQHIFRHSVRHETERALASIGMEVEVDVVLIGFALDEGIGHPICVEPEDGSLVVEHLRTVLERAGELFSSDPESKMHRTVASVGEARRSSLWKRSRAAALVESIEVSGSFGGRTFFASDSTPIGGYDVHTCMGISTADLDVLPTLELVESDRGFVSRSLQHTVILSVYEERTVPSTRRTLGLVFLSWGHPRTSSGARRRVLWKDWCSGLVECTLTCSVR